MEKQKTKTKTEGKTSNTMDKGVHKGIMVLTISELERLNKMMENDTAIVVDVKTIKCKQISLVDDFDRKTQDCSMSGNLMIYEADNNICPKCIREQSNALGGKN